MMRMAMALFAACLASLAAAQDLNETQTVPWTEEFPLVGWPDGDAQAGRDAFLDLKCYQCHAVPADTEVTAHRAGKRKGPGPALVAHEEPIPRMFLLRQIVAPGTDEEIGQSHMGNFAHAMTVQQLTDLIAFLEELDRPAGKR